MPINGLPAAEALGSCSSGPPLSRPAAGWSCGARTTVPSMRGAGAVPACGAGRLCDGGRFVIEGEGCGSRSWARLRWRPEERGRSSCLAICKGPRVGAVVVRVSGGRGCAWTCFVRAVSVGEGGHWARRLGSAEERGCAHLPTVNLCGDPFVLPPLPGTNQPDPCRLLRLARRCCCRKFKGVLRLAGGVQRVSERGRVKQTVNLADFNLPLQESAPRWETSLSVSKHKAIVSI